MKKDKVAILAKNIYELRARLDILWNLVAKYDKEEENRKEGMVEILQEEMSGIHFLEAKIKREVDNLF